MTRVVKRYFLNNAKVTKSLVKPDLPSLHRGSTFQIHHRSVDTFGGSADIAERDVDTFEEEAKSALCECPDRSH